MYGSTTEAPAEKLQDGILRSRSELYYSPGLGLAKALRPVCGLSLESHVQLHGETYGLRREWIEAAKSEAQRVAESLAVHDDLLGLCVDQSILDAVYSAVVL